MSSKSNRAANCRSASAWSNVPTVMFSVLFDGYPVRFDLTKYVAMLRNATDAFASLPSALYRSSGSSMALRSPRRVLYRLIIHWAISSMLSSSLTAVWFWGRSRPASVACCATAWMSEPKLVAALPMRGPAKRFSSIQHTGHAHKLSTADGERVTTSDWPSVFSMDSGCSISFALSACSVFPSDSILPSISVISSAPACSVRNAQLSGFAAAMPCDANNAKACAASRAWGESVGAWASTLREAATRPRGSASSPAYSPASPTAVYTRVSASASRSRSNHSGR